MSKPKQPKRMFRPSVHAYAKRAEVTVPSLDDWEQQWYANPQPMSQPKVLPLNFRTEAGQQPQETPVRAVAQVG